MSLDRSFQQLSELLNACTSRKEAAGILFMWGEFVSSLSPQSRERLLTAAEDFVAGLPAEDSDDAR